MLYRSNVIDKICVFVFQLVSQLRRTSFAVLDVQFNWYFSHQLLIVFPNSKAFIFSLS